MKRSGSEYNLRDQNVILPWITDCIQRHKQRYDFQRLLQKAGAYPGCTYEEYQQAIRKIADRCAKHIADHDLSDLKPPKIRIKMDRSCGKIRQIGCETAEQQLYDFIAVGAAQDVFRRRIVPQQSSSIPRRGGIYTLNMLKKWTRKDVARVEYARRHGTRYRRQIVYHVKLDIKQCFPSADANVFPSLFKRDCDNPDLLWLWETLLATHRVDGYKGMMIGALISQWAVQYLLSFLYRKCMNEKTVTHAMFYMDDILLTGTSRKDLLSTVNQLTDYVKCMLKMEIKPNWHIQRFTDHPVDMVGFRVHSNGHITIRRRTYKRIRRALLRANKGVCLQTARRLAAYKGWLDHSDLKKTPRKILKVMKKIISTFDRRQHYDNSIFYPAAGSAFVYAASNRRSGRMDSPEYS